MGWNEVRVSLVPAGRKIVAERDLAGAPPEATRSRFSIPFRTRILLRSRLIREPCMRRLEAHGFEVLQRGQSFVRMKKGEIETFLEIEDGVVSEVIVTFTLNRSSPLRAPDWQRLISHLVQPDGLALFDRTTQQRVGGDEFLRLLTESPAWKQFAEAHGWPEIVRADEHRPIPVAPPFV